MKTETSNREQNLPQWSSRRDFAVVIPVYNHKDTVGRIIDKIIKMSFEVFLVDDGSTDGSGNFETKPEGLTIIRHPVNMGKGAALLSGFSEASKRFVWAISLDADGQHNPDDIPSLIKTIPKGQRPIIIGKRTGMQGEHIPWTSRFGRKFSNFWVWISGGHLLSDSQSGFRIYPLPETLQLKSKARKFQFEVEILALARWSGMPVLEAPVSVVYQEKKKRVSHFRPGIDFWRNTKTFARLIIFRILLPAKHRAQTKKES